MLQKNLRTIDEYKQAGAKMRLFKTLGAKLVMDISTVLSAKDSDKLVCYLNRIDEICSRAEDNMFRDHPELSSEYTDVFYGSVDSSPRGPLDEEMIERAKQVAGGLFERTDN